MVRMLNGKLLGGAVLAFVSATVVAQQVMVPQGGVPAAATPHLTAIKEHLAKADQAAGDEFSVFASMLCLDAFAGNDYLTQFVGRQFMTGPDQDMDPVRAFDNLLLCRPFASTDA